MKILLVCSSGMSTSLLVNKMIDASKLQGNDDVIWAVGQSGLDNSVDSCEVLLLGPQMKFLLNKIKNKVTDKNIPIDVIPSSMYSKCDGKAVLQLAYDLINNNEKTL